jgi:hypothetical protein
MSAVASPFGFRPAQHGSGLDRARPYLIQNTYATAIYKGDPVAYGATTALGTIIAGPTSGDLLGVLAGVQYVDVTNKPVIFPSWNGAVTGATAGVGPYLPYSSAAAIGWVWDDPYEIFEAQTDGTFASVANISTASAFLPGVIGKQMNCVNVSAGSSLTGLSAAKLAGSTVTAVGAQAQFRVLEPGEQVDNVYTSDQYVIFQVGVAQHHYVSNKTAI